MTVEPCFPNLQNSFVSQFLVQFARNDGCAGMSVELPHFIEQISAEKQRIGNILYCAISFAQVIIKYYPRII